MASLDFVMPTGTGTENSPQLLVFLPHSTTSLADDLFVSESEEPPSPRTSGLLLGQKSKQERLRPILNLPAANDLEVLHNFTAKKPHMRSTQFLGS